MSEEAPAVTTDTPDAPASSGGLDINAAVEQIGRELFPSAETRASEPKPPVEAKPEPPPVAEKPAEPVQQDPALEVPKSWPKEMHEHWGKTPRQVQEYWRNREKQMLDGLDQYKNDATFARSLNQLVKPYQDMIAAQGLDIPRAVERLLAAQQQLTTGTVEQRRAAYDRLGRDLRLITEGDTGTAVPTDPAVIQLQDKLAAMEAGIKAQEQAVYQERYQKVAQEVDAFAQDPKHPYFDECHDNIVGFINQGLSLQDAYDRAVWANPVTREKELARIRTETEAKFKENARLEALPKAKAKGVNVQTRDSQRAPTERLGSMDDTLKETLSAIKART
jgi:hypothetical protein